MSAPRFATKVSSPTSRSRTADEPRIVGHAAANVPPDPWTIAVWVGAAITAAGCAHLLPLWMPLQLRDADDVLAAASLAADAYSTVMLGLFLLMSAFAARARWRPLAMLAVGLAALAIMVLGSGLVYSATAVSTMHELAGGDPAAAAAFRRSFARTTWFHLVAGTAALAGGMIAVELARHYRLRQRV